MRQGELTRRLVGNSAAAVGMSVRDQRVPGGLEERCVHAAPDVTIYSASPLQKMRRCELLTHLRYTVGCLRMMLERRSCCPCRRACAALLRRCGRLVGKGAEQGNAVLVLEGVGAATAVSAHLL